MAGLNHQACGVLDLASAARCPDRVLLSKHSNQNEKPDLGQESNAHDRDRKEHVARRERTHECLASCEAPQSKSFSTVPAFLSVSTTALPINSDCAAPYSFKIFDARRFTDGIARPCLAEPAVLSKAAQRRRLSQRSAAGMIDGDCSSNSRSRSICVLRLRGSSSSSFWNARSLSPIS